MTEQASIQDRSPDLTEYGLPMPAGVHRCAQINIKRMTARKSLDGRRLSVRPGKRGPP